MLLDNPIVPQWPRLSFAEIGRRAGKHPHDAALDMLAKGADDLSQAMVIIHYLNEEQQRECFSHPLCIPGSDATTMAPDGPLANRSFTAPIVGPPGIGASWSANQRSLTPQDAIRRLTGQPAATLGLKDRGEIRVGARADVAAFDGRRASASARPPSSPTSWPLACTTSSSTAVSPCATAR